MYNEEGGTMNLLTKALCVPGSHSWVNHPKVRENWKLVLGAGTLMVLGIGK